jgi:hypothetical protein
MVLNATKYLNSRKSVLLLISLKIIEIPTNATKSSLNKTENKLYKN